MSCALNCGSPRLPGGMREQDLPGDEETAEREECLGCGETACICGEDEYEYEPDEIQAWLDQQEDQQHNF